MKDLNDLLGGDLMGMVGRVQEQMKEAQAELDRIEVEGVSGGGLVRVRASAKGRILGLAIDESLIVPADRTMLEDLVVAAFNDARAKADEAANAQMGKMTAGLPLPPGFKLPF
jgi:DNA-binding YbaB/EbfC family protein